MKFGMGLPNQIRNVDPAIIPDWASRTEKAGFSTLASAGRFAYPGVADTVALAAAAAVTSDIELISNVLLAPSWPAALLAKELAGIDGLSGGRLTVGLGIGARQEDFPVDGLPAKGLGQRIDADLAIYRDIWDGKPFGDGANPAVPAGTRRVPMLFGGLVGASFARMAKWGTGHISPAVPAFMAAQAFDGARAAWTEAGRDGAPRLVANVSFAIEDGDTGRANTAHAFGFMPPEVVDMVVAGVAVGPDAIADAVKSFADIGADDLVFTPTTADPNEIDRLAELLF
jgi:alkanesulfonate monooxygenase SsuD/methylene tetrahydromethanopterin reductase-like flavin-dependent oxidoreductase (luciferase family)